MAPQGSLRSKVASLFKSKGSEKTEDQSIEPNFFQPPVHLLPDFSSKIDSQSSSPLFALPLELRHMIWQLCVGDRVIPLTLNGHPILRQTSSHLKSSAKLVRDVRSRPEYTEVDAQTKDWNPNPLLMSCRRTYLEAIDAVYSTNIFYVSDISPSTNSMPCAFGAAEFPLPALSSLARTMHPYHLHSIRRLVLNLNYQNPPYGDRNSRPPSDKGPPQDYRYWVITWGILATLCGREMTETPYRPSQHPMTRGLDHINHWREFPESAEVYCTWPGQQQGSLPALQDLTVAIGSRYWHMQKQTEHLYSASWSWPDEEWDALEKAVRTIAGVPRFKLILSWPTGEQSLPDDLSNVVIERSTDNGGAIQEDG